ncbi:MAG: IS1634 family transposase [Chloroflexi bacterium]|nr:IS1634 family transposase [Chloroflexota bacterium]
MFVRLTGKAPYTYLQIVENHREGKRVVQRVIATLGRADRLIAEGDTDSLLRSLARYARNVRLVDGYRNGQLGAGAVRKLGPDLVFGRLWQTTGIGQALGQLLGDRKFDFPVERAVYLTALHRLFEPGSDRAADRWRREVVIPGIEELELHHLYRAMRWLGDAKDQVEELLFHSQRDLFTEVSLAFFDTTSVYFHGQGGESLGQYGHSKDHRPDLRQMVVGAVLKQDGRPISSEMWPGNHADATALLPVVDRLRDRFGIRQVCWVADRRMASAATVDALNARELDYILGARMRRDGRVRDVVLARAGRYQDVDENLRVKEVWTGSRRYIVCYNPDEAATDRADREAMVAALEDKLRQGTLHLVGNRGFRRFLRIEKGAARIDPAKVAEDARYDGKFVLLANTSLSADEVAVQYKRLLQVERFFRAIKSVVETRPIYHHWDSTIRGHVFASFLALVLLDELERRFRERGFDFEWEAVKQDLEALGEMEVREGQDWYLVRSALQGVAGKTLQAAGVAIPPSVQPDSRVVLKT